MIAPDRQKAPAFIKPTIFKLPPLEAKTLSNGIPYFEVLTGVQDAVKVEFIFNAGLLYEPETGLAFFTAKLLSSGTAKLSAASIEEKLASYGAFLELNAGHDHAGITVYCLAKFLKEILLVIKQLLTEALFPEEELENLKQIQLQTLKVNAEKTAYLASTGFKKKFFLSGHPYSRSLTEESILKIDRNALSAFYATAYGLNNCTIFISGGGADSFFDTFDAIFGIHKISSKVFPAGLQAKLGSGTFHIEKGNALQSSLRIGLPALALDDPDYYKISFLNEVFGGYFGSRLMKNIREDKGYTYGIHSSLIALLKASYMVIGTDVKKAVLEQTLEEIFKEAKILKESLIGNDEMETVKNYMIGGFLNSINTPFALMEKFKVIYFHALPVRFFETHYTQIENISPEEVLATAHAFLKEEAFEIITAG